MYHRDEKVQLSRQKAKPKRGDQWELNPVVERIVSKMSEASKTARGTNHDHTE